MSIVPSLNLPRMMGRHLSDEMWKFVHAADIHLDSPLRRLGQYDAAPVELLRTATRQALVRLVDLSLAEQVEFVLLAGDLYDGDWDDARTGLFMVEQLSRLREANIPVFAIAGNHDAANRMTRNVPLPQNVRYLGHRKPETAILESLGVAIHGQGFASPAVTENLARHYPAAIPSLFNIGVLHTAIDGREGHDSYAPCSLDDLRGKEYDYWALGHIHAREVISQQPFIAFSGNLQGRHIRETGPKGAYLVTVDERHIAAEFRPLDVVRWERLAIEVGPCEAADDLLALFQTQLRVLQNQHAGIPLAIRIELAGRTNLHQSLAGNQEKWDADLRAVALDVGRSEIWVEQVRVATQARPNVSGSAAEGPLVEVDRLVERFLQDDGALSELARGLHDLRDKLPPELLNASDGIRIDDPEWLRATLSAVPPLLREMLQQREDRR